MKWQDKLTKRELEHIRATTNRRTLAEFKRNRTVQRAWKLADGVERCYVCRGIAKKLGLE